MCIDVAYDLTNRLASLFVSSGQVVQGDIHLHARSVPQVCFTLVQPPASLLASLSERCIGRLCQVLQGMGPIQNLHSSGGQVALRQIPNPIGAIVYCRNLLCVLDSPPNQFHFQCRRKGLFVAKNRSVPMTSQLEAILTPSDLLTWPSQSSFMRLTFCQLVLANSYLL
jgi:hypothetical protein